MWFDKDIAADNIQVIHLLIKGQNLGLLCSKALKTRVENTNFVGLH